MDNKSREEWRKESADRKAQVLRYAEELFDLCDAMAFDGARPNAKAVQGAILKMQAIEAFAKVAKSMLLTRTLQALSEMVPTAPVDTDVSGDSSDVAYDLGVIPKDPIAELERMMKLDAIDGGGA